LRRHARHGQRRRGPPLTTSTSLSPPSPVRSSANITVRDRPFSWLSQKSDRACGVHEFPLNRRAPRSIRAVVPIAPASAPLHNPDTAHAHDLVAVAGSMMPRCRRRLHVYWNLLAAKVFVSPDVILLPQGPGPCPAPHWPSSMPLASPPTVGNISMFCQQRGGRTTCDGRCRPAS
jgi:hypothetical protein